MADEYANDESQAGLEAEMSYRRLHPMIKVEELCKRFDTTQALDKISLKVDQGQVLSRKLGHERVDLSRPVFDPRCSHLDSLGEQVSPIPCRSFS